MNEKRVRLRKHARLRKRARPRKHVRARCHGQCCGMGVGAGKYQSMAWLDPGVANVVDSLSAQNAMGHGEGRNFAAAVNKPSGSSQKKRFIGLLYGHIRDHC